MGPNQENRHEIQGWEFTKRILIILLQGGAFTVYLMVKSPQKVGWANLTSGYDLVLSYIYLLH